MKNFIDGALPPKSVLWQLGKTPASIRFVNDAEELAAQSNSDIDRCLLREAVENIKTGDLVLINFKDPSRFLEEWWEKFNAHLKELKKKENDTINNKV